MHLQSVPIAALCLYNIQRETPFFFILSVSDSVNVLFIYLGLVRFDQLEILYSFSLTGYNLTLHDVDVR